MHRVVDIEGATERTNRVKLKSLATYHQFWTYGRNMVNDFELISFNERKDT